MQMSVSEFERMFASDADDLVLSGVLARSSAEFYPCIDYVSFPEDVFGEVSISNVGVKFRIRPLLCANIRAIVARSKPICNGDWTDAWTTLIA